MFVFTSSQKQWHPTHLMLCHKELVYKQTQLTETYFSLVNKPTLFQCHSGVEASGCYCICFTYGIEVQGSCRLNNQLILLAS